MHMHHMSKAVESETLPYVYIYIYLMMHQCTLLQMIYPATWLGHWCWANLKGLVVWDSKLSGMGRGGFPDF